MSLDVGEPARLRQEASPGTTLRLSGSGVAAPREARRAKRGGARRDRTADLVIANDALSQLSYGPVATASGGPEATDNRRHLQSGPRPSQERCKKSETADFGVILPGTSLVCGGMNRYLADTPSSRAPTTCALSSISSSSFLTSTSGF